MVADIGPWKEDTDDQYGEDRGHAAGVRRVERRDIVLWCAVPAQLTVASSIMP